MTPVPQDLQADRARRRLTIGWGVDHSGEYPFFDLRVACNCAACVDENTGVRILDPRSVSPDVAIEGMQLVGNYAVRIQWSDGHATGLYTWDYLAKLCPCPRCMRRSGAGDGNA